MEAKSASEEDVAPYNPTFLDDIQLPTEDDPVEDLNSTSITPSELEFLEKHGFIMPLPTTVSVITACTLTPKFLAPQKQSPTIQISTCAATVSFKHSTTSSTLTIPLSAEIPAALEWCGYVSRVASEIYQRWRSCGQCPYNLLSFACGNLHELTYPRFPERYTREQQLDRLGLNSQTIDGILDKGYRDICGTQTLAFWVEDTLRANYHCLEETIYGLKRYVAAASEERDVENMVAADVEIPYSTPLLPREHVSVQKRGPILKNHVTLWVGRSPYTSQGEHFTWPELVDEDGGINMRFLESLERRGDFNRDKSAYYFTSDKETAEKFRQYAALRCPKVETWLIRFQVSVKYIKGLTQRHLQYGDTFKDYVWHCRNTSGASMREKNKTLSGKQLIKGPICTSTVPSMWKTKDGFEKTSLGDCNLLYLAKRKTFREILARGENLLPPGQRPKATQWAFIDQSADRSDLNRLGQEIRGKIHIEVTAAIKHL